MTPLQQAAQAVIDRWNLPAFTNAGDIAALEAALEAEQAQHSDKSRLDWLDQNIFSRENLDLFGKLDHAYNMWVMFSPVGVQGSARTIIDAAMARDTK